MKLIFRKARLEDVEGIANLMKEGLERKTWIYTATNKYKKDRIEKLKKELSDKKSTSLFFVVYDKDTQKIVANSGCSFSNKGRMKHILGLGWNVHPDYEGNGIGTKLVSYVLEQAKKKGFKRVEAEIAVENIASKKLALKCGFEIEGTKKKALLTDDGRLIDVHMVGKIL